MAFPPRGHGGPTGYGFDQYRAIIFGDPACNTSTTNYLAALTALNATQGAWIPAASGNVILMGIDNACHAYGTNGAAKTITRGIAFAVNDPTKTGFYYAVSCYYDYTAPATNATLVPQLSGFGTFLTRNYPNQCFNAAHIVATHPIFTTAPPLTDAELSNWGCSTHEGFDVWPSSFVVLAIALTNGTYTATDGSNGVPYILVRGEGIKVISTIDLEPPIATNNIGTPHTMCATISTNVSPYAGVPVTFSITNGPNATTNYTTLTDSNGVACFTYIGNGGLGTDYITASYMNKFDHVITSGTVTKLWQGACIDLGCQSVECISDGTWAYSFCITNHEGIPMAGLSLLNPPAGVSFTPSYINFAPPVGIGQSTNVSVTINAPMTMTNTCFNIRRLYQQRRRGGLHHSRLHQPAGLLQPRHHQFTHLRQHCGSRQHLQLLHYPPERDRRADPNLSALRPDQPCVTFLPPLLDLTLPAYGGPGLLLPSQTRTLNLQVQKTAPCPGTNTFHLSHLRHESHRVLLNER